MRGETCKRGSGQESPLNKYFSTEKEGNNTRMPLVTGSGGSVKIFNFRFILCF